MALNISLLDGKYQAIKVLGSGGFGTVHLAKEVNSENLVAIKKLKPNKNSTIILEEIKVLSKFNHPHIVSYKHQFIHDNTLHIVMEYCQIGNMRILLEKENIRTVFLWNWVKTIADTMQQVHEKGIVHHDLKPENILFTEERTLKIADFGVANTNCGTIHYLAPEFWYEVKDKSLDTRVDVYALGVILLELITKNNPFVGKSLYEKMDLYKKMDFGIKHLPNWQQEIIYKAIAFHPEQRFQTMADFAQAIQSESIPYILNKDNIKAGDLAEKAAAYLAKKRWSKAISLLSYAETQYKPNAMVMTTMGRYHLRMNNINKAKLYLDKALKWNNKIDIQKELGWINLEKKIYPLALSLLTDHAHRNPTDYETYNLIIQCYYDNGRYEQAKDLAKSLKEITKEKNGCFHANYIVSQLMTFVKSPQVLNSFYREYNEDANVFVKYNLDQLIDGPLKAHNLSDKPTLKSKLLFMDYRFDAIQKHNVKPLFWRKAHSDEPYYKIEKPIISIGRKGYTQNDIMMSEDNVISRRHCTIVNSKDDIWLYDLQSTGTVLNNERVVSRLPILGKSIIKIGKIEIEITSDPYKLF